MLQIFLCNSNLNSQNIFFNNKINKINSPIFQTDIFAWDSINKSPINLTKNNISLKVNNIETTTTNFESSIYNNNNENEILIAFSNTSILRDDKLFNLKTSLKNAINSLPNSKLKIGLLAYSNKNFLIKGLTSNFDIIKSGIDLIELSGGNNFNSAFIDEPFPTFEYFTNLNNQKYLLFINIGNSQIDSSLIVQNALSNNIKIISIDLDTVLNNNISNICKLTNGKYVFANENSENNIEHTLLISLLEIIGYKPNQFTWNNSNCDSTKILDFNVNYKSINYNWNDTLKIYSDEFDDNSFSISPNNYVNFGKIAKDLRQTKILSILNSTSTTKVINILIENNDRIKLNRIAVNSILEQNKLYPFDIEYLAKDTNYFHSSVKIFTDNCQVIEIFISAGDKESVNIQTLKLLNLNNREELIANEDFLINWNGIDINDSISIYHSTNSGSTWNLIAENIKGTSYKWKVPDNIGNENLINITKYTNTDKLQGVNYINQVNPTRINTQVEWNYDGSILASANNDESIILWDPFNIKYLNLVYKESFSKIYDIKWSPVRNYLATSVESNLSGNDVLIFDVDESTEIIRLKGNETKPSSLSWSNDGLYLAAGLQNGLVNIWKVSKDANPILSVGEHLNEIKQIAFNPVKNWIVSTNSSGVLVIRDLDNKIEILSTTSSSLITGLEWSPDGKYLVISSTNPNIYCYLVDTNNNKFTLEKNYDIIRQNHPKYNHNIKGLDWSKDGSFLVSYSDKYAQVWDANNGKLVYTYLGHNSLVNDTKINLQNSFASAGSNNQIQVWNLNTIPHVPKVIQSDTSNLTFSINKINVSLKDITFGEYCLNQQLSVNIKNFITNNSKIDILIDSIIITGSHFNDFNIIELVEKRLLPNFSSDLQISFIPSVIGNRSANINVYIKNSIFTAKLTGSGKKSFLELNSNFLLFDETPILEKNSKIIRITNKSNVEETITNLEFKSLNKVFSANNFTPKTIQPNNYIDIELTFTPINSQFEGGVLKIHNLNECTPLEVILKGRGVIPNLEIKNENLFKFSNCPPTIIDTFLTIYNSGSGNLIIKEVYLLRDFNSEIKNIKNYNLENLIIKPGELGKIEFSYQAKSNDTIIITFHLITNLLENLETEFDYELKLFRENSNLTINNFDNNFQSIPSSEPLTKEIELKNTGNIDVTLNNEYSFDNFKINNFASNIIKPNELVKCNITFLGLPNDTTFNQTISINYNCDNYLELTLQVSVNSKGSFLTYPSQIEFPEVNCSTEFDSTIILKNISNKAVRIEKVYFEFDANTNVFFKENYDNLVIQPKEELIINIFYQFNSSFDYSNNLIIETDASNAINNKFTIPIEVKSKLYNFDILNDSLLLEVISNNDIKQEYFEVLNNGNKELDWSTISLTNNYFRLDSIVPIISQIGNISKFYITYLPKVLEENVKFSFEINDNCNNKQTIILNGVVLGKKYINLKMQNEVAKVGEVISIPIFLNNPNLIKFLNTDTIKIKLSFNKTILHPILNSNWNSYIDSIYIDNNNRYIIKYITIKDLIDIGNENFVINNLDFTAALGDTSWTNLKLEEAIFLNKDIKIIAESGSFELSDVCYIDGGRYVKGNGKFVFNPIYPNPSNKEIFLSFNVIENGLTKILLYDIQGRLINTLYNNNLESGKYEMKFDLEYLENDIYYIELRTSTMFHLNKFIKID